MPNDPDYTYGNDMEQMEPNMFSGDVSPGVGPLESKDFVVQDLEYLQGMYPGYMKRLQEYVVSACDHLDYKNSPMYDEYPDRILINQICDSICSQILNDGILSEEQPEADREELDSVNSAVEAEGWGEEAEESERLSKQNNSSWGPPWGPPPGPNRPWGPWGPPPGRKCGPPWGPPCRRPWGPSWGPNRPWGPPWGPGDSKNNRWLNDVVSVLLLNEIHRRRCASGRCR